MTIEKSILEKGTKALDKAYDGWFLIDTKFFDVPVDIEVEENLEPFDTKGAVFTVTHRKTFSKKGEQCNGY